MNIYILTEEKPKITVIEQILNIYCNNYSKKITLVENAKIEPLMKGDIFLFTYFVKNITIEGIDNIYIKIVSGDSSFIDFLFFVVDHEPEYNNDTPLFAVEETKTSDCESRNTGVYQRCTKFIYIRFFYDIPLYMLYNNEIKIDNMREPSDTSKFGTNMLLTCGVNIIGKETKKWFKKFNSIDELITFKSKMKKPPKPNTPISIVKENSTIYISGRLDKPGHLGKISHDPNIGALSIISYTLRKLGWVGKIVITNHNIDQKYINNLKSGNKFLYIAKKFNIELDGIHFLNQDYKLNEYWHYEDSSEKIVSIFLHVLGELAGLKEIYQNHAGCERGYFITPENDHLVLPKKVNDKDNLEIPDLILDDAFDKVVYIIESKKLANLKNGIKDIENYDNIENIYIKKQYLNRLVKRYVTIYGGHLNKIPDDKVLLYINDEGKVYFNKDEHCLETYLYSFLSKN